MAIGSDLDLILIYDLESADIPSDGAKPLMPSTYFLRLTQRPVFGCDRQDFSRLLV